MGNLYLGDTRIETDSMYLGDVPLFDDERQPIFIGDDGKKYYEEDCHIFIANGNEVKFPIPANNTDPCSAVFVAVDGVEVTPTLVEAVMYPGEPYEYLYYCWSVPANENQIIHAIFDWHNNRIEQDWFSDILQFGLNSETGKRNQLKSGRSAFDSMTANPAAISTLDVSNLPSMSGMFVSSYFNSDISGWDTSNVTDMFSVFEDAYSFNSDIGGWNTSKVTDMGTMFYGASSFNQNLSGWCVSLIGSEPQDFDYDSGFQGQTDKQPQWGKCPGGEDGNGGIDSLYAAPILLHTGTKEFQVPEWVDFMFYEIVKKSDNSRVQLVTTDQPFQVTAQGDFMLRFAGSESGPWITTQDFGSKNWAYENYQYGNCCNANNPCPCAEHCNQPGPTCYNCCGETCGPCTGQRPINYPAPWQYGPGSNTYPYSGQGHWWYIFERNDNP